MGGAPDLRGVVGQNWGGRSAAPYLLRPTVRRRDDDRLPTALRLWCLVALALAAWLLVLVPIVVLVRLVG